MPIQVPDVAKLIQRPKVQGHVNVGYFTNWSIYQRSYKPHDVPVEHLTHILYAFANINREDGTVYLSDTWADQQVKYEDDVEEPNALYGNFKQFLLFKHQHRHLKTLLSIGGWTYSSNFRCLVDERKRARFVQSAVQLLADNGLDGLDVDWEYPNSRQEAQLYVKLLSELRAELDAYGQRATPEEPHYLLTIAAPCAPQKFERLDIPNMDVSLDFWNLMAYDFSGSWDEAANPHANLFGLSLSVDRAVEYYRKRGAPVQKLVMGLPLYGRGFDGTTGLCHPYSNAAPGSLEGGVYSYKELPRMGAQESFDKKMGAGYSFDRSKGQLITYETPESAAFKADYILRKGLLGAMFWELSGDVPSNQELPVEEERSLVRIVAEKLAPLDVGENHLTYPLSRFPNVVDFKYEPPPPPTPPTPSVASEEQTEEPYNPRFAFLQRLPFLRGLRQPSTTEGEGAEIGGEGEGEAETDVEGAEGVAARSTAEQAAPEQGGAQPASAGLEAGEAVDNERAAAQPKGPRQNFFQRLAFLRGTPQQVASEQEGVEGEALPTGAAPSSPQPAGAAKGAPRFWQRLTQQRGGPLPGAAEQGAIEQSATESGPAERAAVAQGTREQPVPEQVQSPQNVSELGVASVAGAEQPASSKKSPRPGFFQRLSVPRGVRQQGGAKAAAAKPSSSQQGVSQQAMPKQGIPQQAVPSQSVPLQAVPQSGVAPQAARPPGTLVQATPQPGTPMMAVPPQDALPHAVPASDAPGPGRPLQVPPKQVVPVQGVPPPGAPLQAAPPQVARPPGVTPPTIPQQGVPLQAVPQQAPFVRK